MKSISETKGILVPVDFSALTENGISHAIAMARIFNKPIYLLHVMRRRLLESDHTFNLEKEEAIARLENMAEDTFSSSGIETTALVKSGNVFELIGKVAQELPATMVVMPTHGIHGIQYIVGSNAFRMISTGGEVPFLVVQERPVPEQGIRKVVLPFSFEAESRQKLTWAVELNKLFNCEFLILAENESDEYIAQKVQINIDYARRMLDKNKCRYTIQTARGRENFYHEIVRFATAHNADLIMLMSEEEISIAEYFTGSEEQEILANASQIPVFCINTFQSSRIARPAMFQ
jgi:nucleotide-binding universal stress UspA family protein